MEKVQSSMINRVLIIPTGNEIKNGIVLDTDSPMIMQELLKNNSCCDVRRITPVEDSETGIAQALERGCGHDLVILIGGSGEGHKYSPILGTDCTQLVLESFLDEKTSTALYGKNGHMWSKLVCGRYKGMLVLNVPGPYREAQAAIRALLQIVSESSEIDLQEVNTAMAEAVRQQYCK